MKFPLYILVVASLLLPRMALAEPIATSKPLNTQLESLKQDVLALNRDLLILEEELLYPSNSQLAVFLSVDTGTWFSLDAVKLKVDDKLVASDLYTERQVSALSRGGIQRLYLGNLKVGGHEVSAFFTGKGPQGRDYKRAATITIEKSDAPTVLELKIDDSTANEQAQFSIKQWDI
jgi:hypothetical protein